jgi:N-acetylglucosamine kinase-like BadF-type ATPase
MKYVLGIDGGGTKTIAAIASDDATVCGIGRSGATNFQGIGVTRAGINLKQAVDAALDDAQIKPSDVSFATYGIAGADRDVDFETVLGYVAPANCAGQYMITNDTTIALRAGTKDGVGVALIGGTGANTIGFSPNYEQKKIGGLGPLTGDYGSAGDIARKGVLASLKYHDGRAPKTLLYEMFRKRLDLDHLEDIIEYSYIDKYMPFQIADLAPIVFEAANQNDKVALAILKKTGNQVGHDAVTCMRALFDKEEAVPVVLGGSVYMRGANRTLVDTMTGYIHKRYPNAKIVKLTNEPCTGALLWALDILKEKPVSATGSHKLAASFRKKLQTLSEDSEHDMQ